MNWFGLFLFYSFGGYLLEKGFAASTASPQQVRKCLLLFPLCPVYGLGMLAVLQLPPQLTDTPWRLGLWGGMTVTAVEFAVHWLYERCLRVRFWDYRPMGAGGAGRICLTFSVVWSVLVVLTVYFIQPWAARLTAAMPPWLSYILLLLLTVDAFFSALVLRRSGSVELMSVKKLVLALREKA